MPVTCYPASHHASEVKPDDRGWLGPLQSNAKIPFELLFRVCSNQARNCKSLFQSSFSPETLKSEIVYGTANGFVHAVVRAYSEHHHLVIRPDDVWIAVLAQLSTYVNAHAEELRSQFVSHKGKKELVVADGGNRNTADFGNMARRMTEVIESNVVDPSLRNWIMQEFSTTTNEDRVVTAISMMGTLQSYFTYVFLLKCGLPSVTLLGERDDWVKLQTAVDRLPSFGKEPEEWSRLLKVVFKRFVETFDQPKSRKVRDFWQHVAHYSGGGSGPRYLSGWITAFCFWGEEGKNLRKSGIEQLGSSWSPMTRLGVVTPKLTVSGEVFHRVDSNDVPIGWVAVPVKVVDNGATYKTTMIGGVVGIKVSQSGNQLKGGGKGLDTLQPRVGWWLFERRDDDNNVGGVDHGVSDYGDGGNNGGATEA